MSDYDIDDFELTRLSDVIGNVADDENTDDSDSDIDDVGLSELKSMIKQIKQEWGVENSQENTNQPINLLEKKDEVGKEMDWENPKRKFDAVSVNEELIPQIKYGREELLMLTASPICKLPPPGWKELVKQLPTFIISTCLHFSSHNVDENMNAHGGLQFRKDGRPDKKKGREKNEPYDPCNESWVSPLSRESGDTGEFGYWMSREKPLDGDKEDNIEKEVKTREQKRPQKSVQGLGPQLFQRALADVNKQKPK